MNILFVSSVDVQGGATTALVNLAAGLQAKGHNVYVALNKGHGVLSHLLENYKIPYYDIPVGMTVYPSRRNLFRWLMRLCLNLREWYISIRKIEKLINVLNVDIVHSNVGPIDIGYKAAKHAHIPHVWHQREELDVIGLSFFPSYIFFLKECHSVCNYNIAITKEVFEHYKLRPGKDIVIYDGVLSLDSISIPLNKEKEKIILFVGRVEYNKQPGIVIEAFSTFFKTHPDYQLHIVGAYDHDQEYYNFCRSLVLQYKLSEVVHFLGPRDDVLQLMGQAKMFVMPSLSEGFGFTTVEAMCMGTPVIGRNTTGTKEQFDRGLNDTGMEIGLRFTNVNELVQCMERCVSEDMSGMVNNARHYVATHYTIKDHIDNVERYYKRLLG